jgi:hypothetical protein
MFPGAIRARARRFHGVRDANLRIARAAQRHRFGQTVSVPLLCECDDEMCSAYISLTLGKFAAFGPGIYLTASGHSIAGAESLPSASGEYALFSPYE